MKKIALLLMFLISCIGFQSCTCNRTNNLPKKEKAVEKSAVTVEIIRFEKEFFACNPNKLDAEIPALENKYPTFSNVFFNQVLHLQDMQDKGMQYNYLQEFLTNKYNKGLYDTVNAKLSNLDFLEKDLKIAFANYKSYFPEKPIPKVMTCISEFQIGAFTASDSIIGISLDMYLGAKYVYYADIFQQYTFMIPTFDKHFMSLDCANVLASNIIPPPSDKSTLLDKMLAKGKILYMMKALLPEKKDYDVIKYTDKQWQFCVENEVNIWTYFLNLKLLFNTSQEQFKYVIESPTTYGMPKETPGRAGAWLGWQIINAYMKEHPNTTLKQLIAIKDGQQLLKESKYKPSFKN